MCIRDSFFPFSDFSSFLEGEEDLIFAMAGDAKGIPDVHSYPLFDSRIYLITKKDDPLAGKDIEMCIRDRGKGAYAHFYVKGLQQS